MRKKKTIGQKTGLIIGALFLLYFVIQPFRGTERVFVRTFVETSAEAAETGAGDNSSRNLPLAVPVYAAQSFPKDAVNVVVRADALALAGGTGGPNVEELPGADQISVYVVRSGDRLTDIAGMFGVSENTIIWANDLRRGETLKTGQHLIILPVTGVKHTVAKGDTVSKIALRYKGDAEEIKSYNNLTSDADLRVGEEIIIPDGEETASSAKPKVPARILPNVAGFFSSPLPGYVKTQKIHGHNGVDLTSKCHCEGASILSAAAGDVIIAREGGWNGGYGNYVVIAHSNGTQTLYAHLADVRTSVGEQVGKGQVIGTLGNTGKSTGPHLHFEVRGAKNPF